MKSQSTISRALISGVVGLVAALSSGIPAEAEPRTIAEVLATTSDDDWRKPRDQDLLVMQLPAGRVVFELAPGFAPRHVENILTLVSERWFDGLSINRVQDNFVVQWGDAERSKSLGSAASSLTPEFTRPWSPDLQWVPLPEGDGFAAQAGWSAGFPAARDPQAGLIWLAHCYGAVGVGRDTAADSGSGAELYVVIGHAPRQLDRNVTVVGRVLQGMELLSSLPRGEGPLGFYETPTQRIPILSLTQASRLPPAERPDLEVLRTDARVFALLTEARRNRRDDWYLRPAGFVDLCNVPIPVRVAGTARAGASQP